MKKTIILLSAMLVSTFAFAQDKLQNATIVDYYGIDFSLAKVEGAMESPTKLRNTFYTINNLVLAEYPKYNVAKYLKKQAIEPKIEFVQKRNLSVSDAAIISYNVLYRPSEAEVDSLVQSMVIPPSKNEIGVVIIGELLSKTDNLGHFRIVFFENATKKILLNKAVSGKPAGIGVRNFWAGSILNVLKNY